MKWMTSLAMLLVLGASFAFAQVDAPAVVAAAAPVELSDTDATAVMEGDAPIQITDTEATTIVQTIKGYVQGPAHRGRLNILDRKKGELVSLRLDRIVTDDPQRTVFPKEGLVAICGEFTQMAEKTGDEEAEDKYEVWFVVKRGGIVTSRVLDTYVKSVNGMQMYEWTQGADGTWSATLVPDAE